VERESSCRLVNSGEFSSLGDHKATREAWPQPSGLCWELLPGGWRGTTTVLVYVCLIWNWFAVLFGCACVEGEGERRQVEMTCSDSVEGTLPGFRMDEFSMFVVELALSLAGRYQRMCAV
jgi:hypothetical protein